MRAAEPSAERERRGQLGYRHGKAVEGDHKEIACAAQREKEHGRKQVAVQPQKTEQSKIGNGQQKGKGNIRGQKNSARRLAEQGGYRKKGPAQAGPLKTGQPSAQTPAQQDGA
jgi:hypothetical protein